MLAVDPGNFQTAYCLLNGDKRILGFGKLENDAFKVQFENLLKLPVPPTTVAIEMIASYGLSVGASVFETCVFIGELKEAAHGWAPVVLVPRLEVKLSICRSPKANDSTIRASLIDDFGPPGTKKSPGATFGISADVWAALALAETVRRGDFKVYVPAHKRA